MHCTSYQLAIAAVPIVNVNTYVSEKWYGYNTKEIFDDH